MNNLTFQELHEQLKSTPIALLTTAITNLETNQSKLRSLYRSQIFSDDCNGTISLAIGDGSDADLVSHIYQENQKVIDTLNKAVETLKASSGETNAD